MELRHLRYFVKIAEEKNISRASEHLHVSQPAVSRQLKDLEEELGLPLFNREPKGLTLTEAGKIALKQSRKILLQSNTLIESIKTLAKQSKRYSLKIGYLPSVLNNVLTDAIRVFSETHTEYGIQIFEMPPQEQEYALKNGKIDLALIGDYGKNFDSRFQIETIRLTEQALLVPISHPLAKQRVVDLSEFKNDSFLSLNHELFPGRIELMEELFKSADINPKISVQANGLSELIGLVSSGMGVAIAPLDLQSLPHPNVAFIKMNKPKKAYGFLPSGDKIINCLKSNRSFS